MRSHTFSFPNFSISGKEKKYAPVQCELQAVTCVPIVSQKKKNGNNLTLQRRGSSNEIHYLGIVSIDS